jgi:KDO2-lipid IV(A) lauroyltransferase
MATEVRKERFGRQSAPAEASFRHVLSRPSFYRLGFAVANRVPARILYRVADFVGEASYFRYRERGANVRGNLEKVFPERSPAEIAALARGTFRNFARYLVDYGRFHGAPPGELDGAIRDLEGGDHQEEALRSGKGVILVTGHVGNWELGGLYYVRMGVKVNVVTLPDIAPRIHAIRENYRGTYNIRTIVLDGTPFATVEMVAALRRGEMVAMLVDRWESEDGVRAEFFGRPHLFPRGPFALSRATGAMILPAFVVREGKGYKGVAERPFVACGSEDEPYAQRIAQALERIIRRFPDQWYNFLPA